MLHPSHSRQTVPRERKSLAELLAEFPEAHAYLTYVIDRVQWPADVFDNNPDLHRILELYGLAVLPEYRHRGIATELVRQSLKVELMACCFSRCMYGT